MKVLITGGTSKIGQKLISHLIDNDLDIRVFVQEKEFLFPEQIEVMEGDLLHQGSLLKAVEGIGAVVHLAAITHSNQKEFYSQVNVKGTENLVEAAKKSGVSKFIFMSTRAINPKGGAYSQSKLAAEEIIKNSGIDWIILRPAEVYGIGRGEMIDQLIKLVKKSYLVPIINTKQYPLAPLYIDDLIDALEKVIDQDNLINRTYVLAGPESSSFRKLIEQICRFYRLKRLKIYCPIWLIKFALRILSVIPSSKLVYDQLPRLLSPKSDDISLAKKDIAFNPINFQKGLSLLK